MRKDIIPRSNKQYPKPAKTVVNSLKIIKFTSPLMFPEILPSYVLSKQMAEKPKLFQAQLKEELES